MIFFDFKLSCDEIFSSKDEQKTGAVASPQTKVLSTGNTLVDGAVVGIGVGVLGSLLVGNFLEHQKKKNCFYRYRRQSANPASTR